MKLRFILNRCSGRNRRRPWLAEFVREFIAASHLNADLVTTARPGHATELARAAVGAGCERVVAIGGDGTINEVAQALLHSRTALGLVPCGSGNGLALHLGIPTHLRSALALAARPDALVVPIDSGSVNGRHFFNAMGSGFDADVSRRFNRLVRRGLAAYARTGLAAFRARQKEWIVIHSGGRTEALDTLLVAIGNSDQYGNNARIAPGARIDDGQLDLVAIRPVNLATAVPVVARMFLGNLDSSPRVLRWRAGEFLIERSRTSVIHTDGETHATGATLEVRVNPRSLRIVVPLASRARLARFDETPAPIPFDVAALPP
ncbi:MAG: diacylglycerol kinase [Verrucomicrobia bacterium]|nr:diacylglycerol kinase [Verrucomicrobiota bacterium]